MQQSLTADALDYKQQRNSYAVFSLKNNNMQLETVEALIAVNCWCSGCFWHTHITPHHMFKRRISQDCHIKRFSGRRGHQSFQNRPLITSDPVAEPDRRFASETKEFSPPPEFASSSSLSRFTKIRCYSPRRSALLKSSDFNCWHCFFIPSGHIHDDAYFLPVLLFINYMCFTPPSILFLAGI